MKKTIAAVAASALALLAGTVAVAQSDTARPGRMPIADQTRTELVAKLDARFAKLDTNRDGSITAAERTAARDARRGERFAKLDKDSNGSLSRAEFESAREGRGKMRGGRHGGMHHRGGHGGRDADANGTVTKAEFQAKALARFDTADADRNGTLTVAERQAAWQAHKPRR